MSPTPPLAAILGEVLHPRLYRRWLVAQEDRLFLYPTYGHRCVNPLLLYLQEATGRSIAEWEGCLPPDAIRWVVGMEDRFDAFIDDNRRHPRTALPALDVLSDLDAVLADLGITWTGYP